MIKRPVKLNLKSFLCPGSRLKPRPERVGLILGVFSIFARLVKFKRSKNCRWIEQDLLSHLVLFNELQLQDRKALSEEYEGEISGREGWWRTYIRVCVYLLSNLNIFGLD